MYFLRLYVCVVCKRSQVAESCGSCLGDIPYPVFILTLYETNIAMRVRIPYTGIFDSPNTYSPGLQMYTAEHPQVLLCSYSKQAERPEIITGKHVRTFALFVRIL